MPGRPHLKLEGDTTKRRARNIAVLHLIRFLSSLYFYHQVITLYLQARGLNFVQINSLWGIMAASQGLTEVPTGVVADKIGRKYSIMIALLLQFLGEFIFIFASSYWAFVLVSVIGGVGFSFLSGCFDALMYDSLKAAGREKEMQKVAGLNGSFALAATMAGSAIGGMVTADLTLSHFVYAIILTAFFVFLSFLASLWLSEPPPEYRHSGESSFKLLKDGLHLIKTNRALQRIILLSLLATPFINYLLNFYPPYLVKANVSGYFLGITLAVASLTGALASRYAYLLEKVLGVKAGVFLAVTLPGLFYFLLAAVFHPVMSIVLVVLCFSSMHIQKPIFTDYLNRHIERKNRATVLSLINLVGGLYVAFMGLFIGYLADISLPYSFAFMGGLITLSAFCVRIGEADVTVPAS